MNDNVKRIVFASIISFALVMVYSRLILPAPQQMQVQNTQGQARVEQEYDLYIAEKSY